MTLDEIFSTAETADQIEAREVEYYLKEWLPIPKASTSMITSAGGTGKTMLAIQIAIRIIAENPDRKVLLWLTEDGKGQTKQRLNEILRTIVTTTDKKTVEKNITIIGAETGSYLVTTADEAKLKEKLLPYTLVVIDPLIAFYGYENENNNRDARTFMQIWNRTAIANSQSILFLHHNNKAKENATARGASDFINAVRLLYRMEYIENSRNRKIIVEKENGTAKLLLQGKEVERIVMPTEIIIEKKGKGGSDEW